MSKIRELLKDKESVLVFDIDGVLATMEWGEYTHFDLTDEEWDNACIAGNNYYTEEKVCKKMQEFLKDKDMSRIYVVTKAGSKAEGEFKVDFSNMYYHIPRENVYYVGNYESKTIALNKIKEKYPEVEDCKILMIDDTVTVLNDVMENTNFSTVHVSTFLNI